MNYPIFKQSVEITTKAGKTISGRVDGYFAKEIPLHREGHTQYEIGDQYLTIDGLAVHIADIDDWKPI